MKQYFIEQRHLPSLTLFFAGWGMDERPFLLIRITRLKRATQLLKEGGHTIAEISDMTGFSESKYFREVFKKHYKMSPTKYAKEGSNSSPIITEDNLSDD